MWFRVDPGPCPICDAPHCACTSDGGPVVVRAVPTTTDYAPSSPPLVADVVQATLPPGQFTTGTYRRPKP